MCLKLISFEYINCGPTVMCALVPWCIKSMPYVANIILLHSMNFGIVICLKIIYNAHTQCIQTYTPVENESKSFSIPYAFGELLMGKWWFYFWSEFRKYHTKRSSCSRVRALCQIRIYQNLHLCIDECVCSSKYSRKLNSNSRYSMSKL